MKTATSSSLNSPTSDNSRDGKPGEGRPKSDISKSFRTSKNVVNKRPGLSYRCHRCGVNFDSRAHLNVHFISCARPLDSDDDKNEDEDEDEDDIDFDAIPAAKRKLYDSSARSYAERAVKHLNKLDEGKKYELIEAGPYHAVCISRGPIFHLNLKAKETDCPGAEVENFFAQARMHPAFEIDICVTLEPSHYLPPKPFLDGCGYCKRWQKIHHPVVRCAKFIRGVKDDDVSWLYGDK